jgi:Mg-chelatase subunit ChlD
MASKNTIAFITGGNRGIGLETARELGKKGITVVLGARDAKKGEEAAALLQREGITSVVIDCESGPVRLGLAVTLAEQLGGTCLQLGELAAGELADSVRALRSVA